MLGNFDRCLKEVLKHEGGFVNHPSDPGGMTNLGVTKKVWEEWMMPQPVTEADMRALTPELVAPLYKNRYWDVCRCDRLDAGLDYVVFDIAVNSGTRRAARFLQSAVGVVADGVIGNITISAVEHSALSTVELIDIICNRREAFYRSLPTFDTFGRGWLRRNEEVRKTALDMVS